MNRDLPTSLLALITLAWAFPFGVTLRRADELASGEEVQVDPKTGVVTRTTLPGFDGLFESGEKNTQFPLEWSRPLRSSTKSVALRAVRDSLGIVVTAPLESPRKMLRGK